MYGFYHQASLSTSAKLAAINREYEHKQSLIEKAKAEYSKKNLPASAKTEGGESTFDPTIIYPLSGKRLLHGLDIIFGLEILGEIFLCTTDGLVIVIRDPNDSRFDLEAYLNVVAAENA